MDILLASSNPHKFREFQRILDGSGLTVRSPADLRLPDLAVEETGATFLANATTKAHAYFEAYRIPVLADDSGICVDALAGAPSVRSHRFGPPHLDDDGRLHYMLSQLSTVKDPYRGAYYVCAAVLILSDQRALQAEGYCYGYITHEPHWGPTGFGYDPIFRPAATDRSVAQMSPEAKDAISHRGRASRKLIAAATRIGVLSDTLKR